MYKFIAILVAGISLTVSCRVFADDADPTTQERVGYALSRARSAAQGDKKALASLQTDAAVPDAAAEFGLGEYYALTKDYPQSIAWLKKSAAQHFVGAYYGLGKAYNFGKGVSVDYAQAMHLYLQATELPDAEISIGNLYFNGQGVEEDDARAIGWYLKAAQAGSIQADTTLGAAYQVGSGVEQDDAQAMRWYQKAADAGDATAEYELGLLYERSDSLQDYKRSALWYQKASQQGVAAAQLRLGLLYTSGKGVPVDAGKAVQQFQMAANQDQPEAQYHLAESFATGAGVPVDPFRAYQWFTLAEMSLDAKDPTYVLADQRIKKLEGQMNPAQISQAKQAVADWRKSHAVEP